MPDTSVALTDEQKDTQFSDAFRRAAELAVSADLGAARLAELRSRKSALLASREALATAATTGSSVYVGSGSLTRQNESDVRRLIASELADVERQLDIAEALLAEWTLEWSELPAWARQHAKAGAPPGGLALLSGSRM